MRRPCSLYGIAFWGWSLRKLCQIGGRQENEFQRRVNGACPATKVWAGSEGVPRRVDLHPQWTVNGLTQRLNQSDSIEELLPLLRRFKAQWEQYVVLGDHRWQEENMKAMQRFAKGLSKELLNLNSKNCDLWDAEVRNQARLLSGELYEFVKPDMRRLSVQDIEVMVAHGRVAYEMTRQLISNLESEKLTRKPSDE
jgi:hypothetical protein